MTDKVVLTEVPDFLQFVDEGDCFATMLHDNERRYYKLETKEDSEVSVSLAKLDSRGQLYYVPVAQVHGKLAELLAPAAVFTELRLATTLHNQLRFRR